MTVFDHISRLNCRHKASPHGQGSLKFLVLRVLENAVLWVPLVDLRRTRQRRRALKFD
jgi:hypothetical protein